MKHLILFIFFVSQTHAFTLLQRDPPRYGDTITIRPSDSDCANAGLTAPQLKEFIQRAIDDYWNSVPTSRMKFRVGHSISIPASSTTTQMVQLIPTGEIIVGCSDNATTFTSGSTLAVGGMLTSEARGVVAINDIADTRFDDVDELSRVSTFAHELGHAIGIGHSKIDYSLMYYSVVSGVVNEHLTEDDADAITYLYPKEKKAAGLGGACGSIDLGDGNSSGGPMIPTLLFTLLLVIATPRLSNQIKIFS